MLKEALAAFSAAIVVASASSAIAEDIKAKSIIEMMLAKQAAREKATMYYVVRESHSVMDGQEMVFLYGRVCAPERTFDPAFAAPKRDEDGNVIPKKCDASTPGYSIVRPKELEYMFGGENYMAVNAAAIDGAGDVLIALGIGTMGAGIDVLNTTDPDDDTSQEAGADLRDMGAGVMDMGAIAKKYARNPRKMNEYEQANARDSVMDMRKFGTVAKHLGNIKLHGREAFVLLAKDVGVKGNTNDETLEERDILTLGEIAESERNQVDYEINAVMLAIDSERLVPLGMGIWGTTKQKKGKAEPFQIFREDRDYFKVKESTLYIPKTTTTAIRLKLTGMDAKEKKELEKALKDYEKMKKELDELKEAREGAGAMMGMGAMLDEQIAKMEEMVKMMEVTDDVHEAEINLEVIQGIFDGGLVGNVRTTHAATSGKLLDLGLATMMQDLSFAE